LLFFLPLDEGQRLGAEHRDAFEIAEFLDDLQQPFGVGSGRFESAQEDQDARGAHERVATPNGLRLALAHELVARQSRVQIVGTIVRVCSAP
jgi:hypothetical protein